MIIHRILSAFLLIFIVVPVYIVYCLLKFIFHLANSFTYHNFWYNTSVPEWVTQKYGVIFSEAYMKFMIIVTSGVVGLIDDLKQLKTCKF